ncbi:MAG: MFS transporter, partial [Betaproteobacteria bacterium HGW-Betaproteobacteria-21]
MNEQRARLKVLGAGIFSLLLVLGVARFSYTPLLPLMQEQAGLGVAEAGWLAAINYAGYLSGAVIASLISDLVLKDRLYRIGMVLAVLSTVVMGLSTDITVWAISRFIAGLSSAAGMLLGTGLILNWLIRHNHRSELGIHFSGVGLGIAGCAAAVALMSEWLDWREQWFAFTAIGCVLLVPALRWLPPPDRSGLTTTGQKMEDRPPSALFMRIFMAAYFCAGVGYVVSATFIVAIVDRLPGLEGQGTLAFLAIGIG